MTGIKKKLLQVAAGEVGYRESGENRTKYGAWYGADGQAWCMMFVSWCAAQAGVNTEVIPKMAYCPYAQNWFKEKNRLVNSPEAGDLIFFDPDGNGRANHVGLVEEVKNAQVHTIEGNQGDQVKRCVYTLTTKNILGYGRPAYGEEEDEVEIKTLNIRNLDTGKTLSVQAVNVEGSNYIRLRDAEKLFPVIVDFDGEYPTLKQNLKEA